MKSRYKIWILFLGIVVAILCAVQSSKETGNFDEIGRLNFKHEKEKLLSFYNVPE